MKGLLLFPPSRPLPGVNNVSPILRLLNTTFYHGIMSPLLTLKVCYNKILVFSMSEEESKYYSMEFVDEDGRVYVKFYNVDGKLVAKREVPQGIEIELPNTYKN